MKIIIFKTKKFKDRKDLFSKVFDQLQKLKIVHSTFLPALEKREEEFPTGLICIERNIAIPHTDSEHILKDACLFVFSQKPLFFQKMDDRNQRIPVSTIIFILTKTKNKHMNLLTKILELGNIKEIPQGQELHNFLRKEV